MIQVRALSSSCNIYLDTHKYTFFTFACNISDNDNANVENSTENEASNRTSKRRCKRVSSWNWNDSETDKDVENNESLTQDSNENNEVNDNRRESSDNDEYDINSISSEELTRDLMIIAR